MDLAETLAELDARRAADMRCERQEVRLAPWALALGSAGTGAALFAAAAAFVKLVG